MFDNLQTMPNRARALRLLLAGALHVGLVACAKTEPQGAAAPGPATTGLNAAHDGLAQALVASPTAEPIPCDERALRQRLGAAAAKVLVAPKAQVAAWVSGDARSPSAADFLDSRLLDGISFRVTSEDAAVLELTQFRELQDRRPFLALVEMRRFSGPVSHDGAFKPGEADGLVTLFALGESEALCSATFHAESSAEVAQRTGEELTDAVRQDFEERVKRSVQEAVSGLSPKLSP